KDRSVNGAILLFLLPCARWLSARWLGWSPLGRLGRRRRNAREAEASGIVAAKVQITLEQMVVRIDPSAECHVGASDIQDQHDRIRLDRHGREIGGVVAHGGCQRATLPTGRR